MSPSSLSAAAAVVSFLPLLLAGGTHPGRAVPCRRLGIDGIAGGEGGRLAGILLKIMASATGEVAKV
eukprot:jgi/Chlat1/4607/Chrsp290S04358